ncbi:MAG: hypothetical protein IT167_06960 [Bryobacterales bacterium]|nr:hypothetical protein [Bryobacterales bacterium]
MVALIWMALAFPLNAQTAKLPISDFLAVQGQSSIFIPPVQDFLGWAQALCTSRGLSCITKPPDYNGLCLGYLVSVDYAGLADKYITDNGGQSSGTVMEGSVLVRPIANNRIEVTVSLHTKNALTFVLAPYPLIPGTSCMAPSDANFATQSLTLGARANTLPPFSQRALGDSFWHITFQNPAGAPLPDLIDLFNNRFSDIFEYSFHAVATGPMAAGGEGTVTVQQASKGSRENLQPAVVNLRQTGH